MSGFRLNDRQSRTLQAIFEDPVRPDLNWSNLKELLVALGGAIKEDDDRVFIVMKSNSNTTRAVIHRRHQSECASTHAIGSIQKLLKTSRTGVIR